MTLSSAEVRAIPDLELITLCLWVFGTDLRSFTTGGTAGLVLANRLTESGDQRVLVLEAGQEPTIVAAYSTPGGNQFLKGRFNSSIDRPIVTN